MATAKTIALQQHTAGIYADMSIDGPEIGMLIAIVDRAKNLPNRKTIGKQHPYCAARLGKEAKKTQTDVRGGQTPRWDKELRFKVHDSPDYYQLKVSVFNDDKKTELIGETWVRLEDVIGRRKGTSDGWHSLTCKGKYAGEVRLELTFFPDKTEEKPRKPAAAAAPVQPAPRETVGGPRSIAAPVKRRPLPVNPTGATSSPAAAPAAAAAVPNHVQTPPRAHPSPAAPLVPKKSPLQDLEYNTPIRQSRHQQQDHVQSEPAVHSHTTHQVTPPSRNVPGGRYERYDSGPPDTSSERRDPGYDPYDRRHEETYAKIDASAPYELPAVEDFDPPPSPGGPPPPPPIHRSNPSSQSASFVPQGVYATSPHHSRRPSPLYTHQEHEEYRHNSAPVYPTQDHEEYRHNTAPVYHSQQHSYQAYNPMRHEHEQNEPREVANNQVMAPRHHSFDDRYHNNYASMQPSVEDDPDSMEPRPSSSYRGDTSQAMVPSQAVSRYNEVPSPAPLNVNGRASANSLATARSGASTVLSNQFGSSYDLSSSSTPFTDASSMSSGAPFRGHIQDRRYSEDPSYGGSSYDMREHPVALVPGMDPTIAQELSERIYRENRYSYSAGNSPRGREIEPPQYQQSRPHPLSQQEMAPATYSAAVVPVRPRAISPDTRTIKRKSVSPAPPVVPEERRLSGVPFGPDSYNALNPKLAGSSSISFSSFSAPTKPQEEEKIILDNGKEVDPSDHLPPDSWAPEPETKGPKYASQQVDQSPLRSRPSPGGAQPMPTSGRRQLKVAGRPQSMQNPSPVFHGGNSSDPSTPSMTSRNRLQKKPAHRHTGSAAPGLISSMAAGSSPLAPISPHHDNGMYTHGYSNGSRDDFAPKPLQRPATFDYGENARPGPGYGNSYAQGQGYRGTIGGPPVPHKVPVGEVWDVQPYGSHSMTRSHENEAQRLLEEMKTIDLGTGRSRRRGR